jgi:chemotaxis protein MotB
MRTGSLPLASIQGASVVPDGDVVRIRIDSAQLFASGRADLKPDVGPTLDRIAQTLQSSYAGRRIGIEGHTDSDPITKSKWKSNYELSEARAQAVGRALQSRGIADRQFFVTGYGPDRPLAPNDSKGSKSQNRRVEIVVYPDDRATIAP